MQSLLFPIQMRLKCFHLWRVKSALQRINSEHTHCKYLRRAPGLYWLSKQHYNVIIMKTKPAEICDCHFYFGTPLLSEVLVGKDEMLSSQEVLLYSDLQPFPTSLSLEEEPGFDRDPQCKF